MSSITNTNAVAPLNQLSCFRARAIASAPGRLAQFPDVNILQRPNFLPNEFIDALGRSGRSGRLCRDDWVGGKTYVFFPYGDSYREHVLNVRTSGNDLSARLGGPR
jgi:hypothetical protein